MSAADPNIVVLAGGVSSRMKQQMANPGNVESSIIEDARLKSKAMIGVGEQRKPFLDYLLSNIEQAGYTNVVIVVGERDDTIRRHYEQEHGAAVFTSLRFSFVVQEIPEGRDKPLGTANALLTALRGMAAWKGRKFTVCNSDNLYAPAALRLLLFDTHANALIDFDRSSLKFEHERIMQFALLKKDSAGYVESIIEKPSREQLLRAADAQGRVGVSMNIFRLSYDAIVPFLESVPLHPQRGEKELPVAVNMMIERHPQSMFAISLAEHVPDLTMQTDIPTVMEYLRKLEHPQ